MTTDVVLETERLTKLFGGFVAVNGVSLQVRRGSIHALIGPNGAGKTTLFNLLTRFIPASSGRVLLNGRDITRASAEDTARQGMVRSFQISAVFPHMSVLQNVRVALQRSTSSSFAFWRSKKCLSVLDARALQLLSRVGLESFADSLAVELPYGRKRALELATTLALDPEVMLLDEPTQGMGHEDIGRVMELIRQVAANRTILMVEHNMNVVSRIADRITVLQRGATLAEGSYEEVAADSRVVAAYMGKRS